MPLVAVNVCLISSAFDTAAVPLSWGLCPTEGYGSAEWDSEKSYRLTTLAQKTLHRSQGYSHCTVAQLCVRSTNLEALRKEVRQIWLLTKDSMAPTETLSLTGLDDGPSFSTTQEGATIYLPNIKIELSHVLRTLHEKIVAAVRPFHVPPLSPEVGRAAFHPNFPPDNVATVEWMKNFLNEYALDSYKPHITLGATPSRAAVTTLFKPTQTPWSECRLVVCRMGNYCSSFELL